MGVNESLGETMKNNRLAIAILLGAFGLAGCASTADTQKTASAAPPPGSASIDPTYVTTGSRLPPSPPIQPVRKVDKEDWNRSRGVIGNLPAKGF